MTRYILASLVFVLGAASAMPAAAQPATVRARELFDAGVRALEANNPGLAAQHFEQSYRLAPRASTACNMAMAQERLRRPCEAERWYTQCSALDQNGRFREQAAQQSAQLSIECREQQANAVSAPNDQPLFHPIQGTSTGSPNTLNLTGNSGAGGGPRIIEDTGPEQHTGPGPDHTTLGFGIGALALAAGSFVGGVLAIDEAHYYASFLPEGGGALVQGSEQADDFYSARTWTHVGYGLYVGGAVLSFVGAILTIVDLAQPGVFSGSAQGPALRLSAGGATLQF